MQIEVHNHRDIVLMSPGLLGTGVTIGSYRVVKKLGEGGMGSVYLGEHTLLGRPAAIKMLLPSLSTNEECVQRFFNEARTVARIADPGIVQVFDFGHHTDGSAFIVMELLEGEPMDRRLKRIGRFEVLEALRLMRLVCTSLEAAHGKGIIHRDLKPENIFIVQDPGVPGGERAKILDFGIAKLAGDEPGAHKTRTGAVMGTPMYMSPEQCSGSGIIDHRSDIYAIACVMFAMLTGRPPFDGAGAGDLIASHLREPPPLASWRVPELPRVVENLLQRCLQKSPAERFQSMAELTQALAAAERTLLGSNAAPPSPRPSETFVQSPSLVTAEHAATLGPGPLLATPEHAATLGPGLLLATPVSAWAGTNLSNPTTLNDASGQASMRFPVVRPRGRRWIAGLVTVVVGGLGAAAVIAQWNSGDADPPRAEVRAAEPPATLDAPSTPPHAVPPPIGQPSAVATETSDAGVSDAPSPAFVVDAAVAQPHRKPAGTGTHRATTRGEHEGTIKSTPRPYVDRTD